MNATTQKTITVDYEHNCEIWWDAAREAIKSGNTPTACIGLIDSVDTITVDLADAEEFIAWASELPGWSENPFVIA